MEPLLGKLVIHITHWIAMYNNIRKFYLVKCHNEYYRHHTILIPLTDVFKQGWKTWAIDEKFHEEISLS